MSCEGGSKETNEEKRAVEAMDDRITILLEMLDAASIPRMDPDRMVGPSDFARVAIQALVRKYPTTFSFYAKADEMRIRSESSSKNENVDPFLVAARIGYAYAMLIFREWESMTDKPAIETISEGPSNGSCQG